MRRPFSNQTPPNRLKEVEREVANALAKVAFFISPKVVRHISALNCDWQKDFQLTYGDRITASTFFFEGSSCVFPGVRRFASSDERKLKRHKFDAASGAILDLNWFPRELWCFLCAGRQYSADVWRESGLGQFELAHVLPHKSYELPGVESWFSKLPSGNSYHALFTCAANVILLPKGMARPTDGTAGIRMAILNRYFELYGDTHAGGFGGFMLPPRVHWYKELQWNEPVEPLDWEERIAKLDEFRRRKINSLLQKVV